MLRDMQIAQKAGARSKSVAMLPSGQKKKIVTVPRSIGAVMQADFHLSNGKERGSVRIQGQDWLCRVTQSSTDASGTVFENVFINPLELSGTRLALFAQLYDKFRFNNLRFHFVPCASTTVRGSIGLSYDRDISDVTPPPNDMGVRQFLSMMDAVSGPLWNPLTANCPLSHPEEGLFTNPSVGGDERLSYQGQLYVWCLEPAQNTGEPYSLGDVFVEYDIEMWDPQLDTQVVVARSTAGGGAFSTGVGNNDALRQYATGGATSIQQYGITNLLPKLDSNLRAYIDAAQGVYRISQNIFHSSGTGQVSVSNPTCIANTPKPAPAPQVDVASAFSATADDDGNYSANDVYVSVPAGGGRIYQSYLDASGVDATSGASLRVEQVSPYWLPAASFTL